MAIKDDIPIDLSLSSGEKKLLSILTIGVMVVFLGAILTTDASFFEQEDSLSAGTVTLEELDWDTSGLELSSQNGRLSINPNLRLTSSQDSLNVKVYNGDDIVADRTISEGENYIGLRNFGIEESDLGNSKRLEVCYSHQHSFSRSNERVYCQDEMFHIPMPRVEVSPRDIDISEYAPQDRDEKKIINTITIENTGEVGLRVGLDIEYSRDDVVIGQNIVNGPPNNIFRLDSGQEKEVDLETSIGYADPRGYYSSELRVLGLSGGYVGSSSPIFSEEVDIQVEVKE